MCFNASSYKAKLKVCVANCVQVLVTLSDVGSNHAEAVLSVLRSRREEIRRSLLDRTNSISSAVLGDFDWQLKVTFCYSAC